jgi:hypothetical protein
VIAQDLSVELTEMLAGTATEPSTDFEVSVEIDSPEPSRAPIDADPGLRKPRAARRPARETVRARSADRSRSHPPSRASATRVLVVLQVAAILAWAGFFGVPAWRARAAAASAVPGPLPGETLFETITPRAPSMFLTVRPAAWQALSPAARLAAVENLAAHLESGGYSGLLILAPDGRALAHWLRESGSELILDGEGTPPADTRLRAREPLG